MDITCYKSHKPFWILFSFFLLSLFTFKTAFAQDNKAGEKVFKQNCAVCHSLGSNTITGPGLEGVFSRVPSKDWMKSWIKNPSAMKKTDAYAAAVDKKFPTDMTAFAFLSDQELDDLIAYIENPPKKVEEVKASDAQGSGTGEGKQEGGMNPLFVLLAVIVFLFIIIAVLRTVRQSLRNVVNSKQGLPEQPPVGMWAEVRFWMDRNKRIVALFIIILIGMMSKWAWDGMMGIGIYEGYKPSQPIKFSHKVHANDNGIACVYCHSSVEKSKVAGIPPVSTCMNCHKGIQEGPTTGTDEIAKIHAAAGFDPKTGQVDPSKEKPLVWNKVHNLPDFVYFNHSQHVTVGKRQCEECHGDVKSMDVVQQVAPLTMGWCVDCHRKTEVAMADNPYYERLHTYLKKKYEGQKMTTFTVDKIGGLDCVKCHY
jgi:cytochrome c2